VKYVRLLLTTTGLSFVEVHRQLGLPEETRRSTTRAFAGGRQVPRPEVVEALIVCCRRRVTNQTLMQHYEQTLRDLYAAAQRHPPGPDVDPAEIMVELGTPAPAIGERVGAQSPPNPPTRENLRARVLGTFTTWPRRLSAVGGGALLVILIAAMDRPVGPTGRPTSAGSAPAAVAGGASTSVAPAGSASPSIAAPADVAPTHGASAAPTTSGGITSPHPVTTSAPSTAPNVDLSSCGDVDGSVRLGEVRRHCAALPLKAQSKIDLDSDAANWDARIVATSTDPYDPADIQLTSGGLGIVVPSNPSNQLMTTTKNPDFATCTAETSVTNLIPLNEITPGNAYCVHTNDRRYARLVIGQIMRNAQGVVTGIELQVTVWGRNGQ
jgi:hypothetical protein